MRPPIFTPAVIAWGSSLILVACGGHPTEGSGNLSQPPPPAAGPGIPALPVGDAAHPRTLSTAEFWTLAGEECTWSVKAAAVGNGALRLAPEDAPFAAAMFAFSSPPGSMVQSISYKADGVGVDEQVWLAISDYDAGAWSYLAPGDATISSLEVDTTPGRYFNPAGKCFVVVLAAQGCEFTLESVSLRFAADFVVGGRVLDPDGQPVAGALVSATLGDLSTVTAGDGSYLLAGLTPGTWGISASKPGWAFFSNPRIVTIDFDDIGGADFRAYRDYGHWWPVDQYEPNDSRWEAVAVAGIPSALEGGLDFAADPEDWYRVSLSAGTYLVELDTTDGQILYPFISVMSTAGAVLGVSESLVIEGKQTAVFSCSADQDCLIGVDCKGNGGTYRLSVQPQGSVLTSVHGQVTENLALMKYAPVRVTDPSGKQCLIQTAWLGQFDAFNLAPAQYTVAPEAPSYSFEPSELVADTTSGDVTGLRFEALHEITRPDFGEPNEDPSSAYDFGAIQSATTGELARIGGQTATGYDFSDWYRFTPPYDGYCRITFDPQAEGYEFGGLFDVCRVDVNEFGEECFTTVGTYGQRLDGPGTEVRFGPAYGGAYMIRVVKPDSRTVNYRLNIEPLPGVRASFALDPEPAYWSGNYMGLRFIVYSDDFRTRFSLNGPGSQATLLTKPGEVLNTVISAPNFSAIDGLSNTTPIGQTDRTVVFDLHRFL